MGIVYPPVVIAMIYCIDAGGVFAALGSVTQW